MMQFADLLGCLQDFVLAFENSLHYQKFVNLAANDAARFKLIDEFFADHELGVKVSPQPSNKSEDEAARARSQGNALFVGKKFAKALDEYNKSVCFAPSVASNPLLRDSERTPSTALAFAYGNRSAVFYAQGRYLECIADIDRAVACGYPAEKLPKLLLRKAKAYIATERFAKALECLGEGATTFSGMADDKDFKNVVSLAKEALESQKLSGEEPLKMSLKYPDGPAYEEKAKSFLLTSGCHSMVPCASSLLELKFRRDTGLRFVAAADIQAGDVLLKDRAFISAIDERRHLQNCLACSVWTDRPVPCPQCANVVFCSDICASGDRALLHKKECAMLWAFKCDYPDAMVAIPASECWGRCVYNVLLMKTLPEWHEFAAKYPGNMLEKAAEQQQKGNLQSQFHSDQYDAVCGLRTSRLSVPERGEQVCAGLSAWYVMKVLEVTKGYQRMEPELRVFLGGLAMRHFQSFGSVQRNDYDAVLPVPRYSSAPYEPLKYIMDHCSVQVGVSVYPAMSFMSTSCAPNAAVARFASSLIVRAIRPIKRGEVIGVAAVECRDFLIAPKMMRQAGMHSLSEERIPCKCRACVENWPSGLELHVKERKVRCLTCHCEFIRPAGHTVKCTSCGSVALRQLWKKVSAANKEYDDAGWKGAEVDEAKLASLLDLSEEASKCLEEPDVALNTLYNHVQFVWFYQGNRRFRPAV